MEPTLPNESKRWTAARRTALVLQILRGETTANEAARQYDLKPSEIMAWQEAFLAGGQRSLKSNPNDELHHKERKIEQLHRKNGEMTMALEVLKKANEIYKRDLDTGAAHFGQGNDSNS